MTFPRPCSIPAFLLATAMLAVSFQDVLGCACCTDSGEYNLVTDAPLSEYHRAQLEGLQFAPAAQLYLTDAGEDSLKGLGSITQENTVSVAYQARWWRLTFRTADGKTGTLSLPLPARMTRFSADLHDSDDRGQGPVLYKEWRCAGVPKGDGIFEKGFTAPARYTLIFQGRGNRCDNAEDLPTGVLRYPGPKQATLSSVNSSTKPPPPPATTQMMTPQQKAKNERRREAGTGKTERSGIDAACDDNRAQSHCREDDAISDSPIATKGP